ncbi:MAG: hypothetical protein QM484_14505 [Woeseiaceae bacterium]
MKKWDVIRIDPKGFISLSYITPITPKEYLEYADKDLLQGGNHGYVNALSNAKRAIDCQITNLLFVLGLPKSGNIHKKIEKIENIGILAPRILKKVNKIRNLLEHEFQKPTADEAEDAVDIATLFIGATEKVFMNFMDSFWIARDGSENRPEIYKEGNKTIIMDDTMPQSTFSDGIYIAYDQDRKDYGIWGHINNKEVFEAEVKKGSPLHIELIQYSTLNHYTDLDYEEDATGRQFVDRVYDKSGISL